MRIDEKRIYRFVGYIDSERGLDTEGIEEISKGIKKYFEEEEK